MKANTQLRAGQYVGGSFYDSCENIDQSPSQYGVNLDGFCQRRDGTTWNRTSIFVPWDWTGDISNCDGDLYMGWC